ncbi:hypothetical protein HYE69_02470 [Staphylococcus sp. GSSP0090]|nr:hypothetical protein [Staphylococcus sp. GSSP0090]
MITVTGIGNIKEIVAKKLKENNINTSVKDYDLNKIINDKKEMYFVIYDGLYIAKYWDDFSALKNINHIPIFVTTYNIYVFGINKLNHKKYTCPYCISKRITIRDFNLKLYDNLLKRIDFKTISFDEKSIELDHFVQILLELIDNSILDSNYFHYDLLNNFYFTEKVQGLSNCPNCDYRKYDQNNLLTTIKEVLKDE